MYIFTRLPLIAVFFVLTGCSSLSSLNPFSSKLDPKNAPAILEDFKPTLFVRKVWSVSVGSAGNYVFSPASDGRNLYTASSDGTLVKIDSVSGNVLWRINSGTRLTGGVGADSLTVAVAGDKGLLSAFDSDGKLRWKVQNSTEMLSAPVVGDGLVVARSIDNRVSAFDAQTGKRKWVVERPLPALTLRTVPGLVIENHQVLVALPGGHMISISTETGAVRWDSVVGEPKGATELERVADVSGMPAVVGSDVCAVAYQGRVACFALNSGSLRWAKPYSSEAGVGLDERFVFAVDTDGVLNAYLRDGGVSAWRNDKLKHRHLSAPASFGRSVVIGDMAGFVHFLSREDGSFIGRISTDGSQILAAPIVIGANLVIQTKSGSVVALAIE